MKILITGGTGSLGNALVRKFQKEERIVVYSRCELKQAKMKEKFPEGGEKGLRYFIGEVRDRQRLIQAMKDIDVVIHCAAMKRIETCEYNPTECMATNVNGTQNVIEACIANDVKKAVFISTDKAPNPTTIYGASKLMGERLWINANNRHSTKFSAVRYGNVIGSNGSFYHKWLEQAGKNIPITITHPAMNRFFFTIEDAVQLIVDTMQCMQGGEIFVKKMKSFNMYYLANAIQPNTIITGIRGYEKLDEILLTEEEVRHTWETVDKLIIYPHTHDWCRDLPLHHDSKKVPAEYRYTTKENLHAPEIFFDMIDSQKLSNAINHERK